MENDTITAILGFQRGLLDTINPNLRAVSIKLNVDNSYSTFCYYSGTPSEKILDLWSCAVTEMIACMELSCMIEEHYLKIDPPTPIPIEGSYVYLKRGEVVAPAHIFHISLKELNTVTLRIAAQNALLGKIPDQVRAVIIDTPNGNARISVYIDTQEMGECIHSLESAFKTLQQDLPEGITLETAYHYVPAPQRIQGPGSPTAWYVYARYEETRS